MAEWLNAPVLKTGGRKARGFESHSLRSLRPPNGRAPQPDPTDEPPDAPRVSGARFVRTDRSESGGSDSAPPRCSADRGDPGPAVREGGLRVVPAANSFARGTLVDPARGIPPMKRSRTVLRVRTTNVSHRREATGVRQANHRRGKWLARATIHPGAGLLFASCSIDFPRRAPPAPFTRHRHTSRARPAGSGAWRAHARTATIPDSSSPQQTRRRPRPPRP